MAKKFKQEYVNCTITVKSLALGKVEVDTSTADPNEWAKVPELAFLFEDEVKEVPAKAPIKKMDPPKVNVSNTEEPPVIDNSEEDTTPDEDTPDLTTLNLTELRAKFPDIKASSKAKFLEKLGL